MKRKSFWFLLISCISCTIPQLLFAQFSVTGTVVDEFNSPLPSITVNVKGTAIRSITDQKGNFKIQVMNDEAILLLGGVGLQTREVAVKKGQPVVRVTLFKNVSNLDEVVVIGYGTAKRKDLTGSVGSVDVKSMQEAPVLSFDEALAGRVAGVQVSSDEGMPGSGMNIIIRGANSLTQDNSPLYVIDGFPIENPENAALNPEEIESIDVLKDASATAIYGARGANGVIVIQTKRGKEGLTQITASASIGTQETLKKMDLLSGYDFVEYQYSRNPTIANEVYLDSVGRTLEDYRHIASVDWQDMMFRSAPIELYNIAMRGGSKQTKFSISGSVGDQKGIMINSELERLQGRFNIDHTVNNKLTVGLNTSYSVTKQNGDSPSVNEGFGHNNLMFRVWGYRPVTGNDFNLIDEFIDPDGNDLIMNPIISAKNEYKRRTNKTLTANLNLNYKINRYWTLNLSGGINSFDSEYDVFNNSFTRLGSPRVVTNLKGVNGSTMNSGRVTWLNENTLTWKRTYNKIHSLEAVGGFTIQSSSYRQYGFAAQDVPNETLGMSGLDQGTPYQSWASESLYSLASFLGRVNYNLMGKYLLTGTIRADGTSKFSPKNRWSYFPSGAFAWQMGKEKFMENINVISDAKIRISYGVTGNNRVTDFAYMSELDLPINAGYSYNNSIPSKGAIPNKLGNMDLKWESTSQTDLGIDLGFFKDRIRLTADVYRKTTYDLLLNADLPAEVGFTTAFKNIGKIRNDGLELTLETVNIRNTNFSWQSSFNISFNRSKVMELTEGQQFLPNNIAWDTGFKEPLYLTELGSQPGLFFGYVFDGVYNYDDFDEVAPGKFVLKPDVPTNGDARNFIAPGQSKYKDLNGDGVVTSDDRAVIGNAIPNYIGGFGNIIRYKNFTLNALLQWSVGNDIYNANRLIFEQNVGNRTAMNMFASVANRWRPENPDSQIPVERGQTQWGKYSSRVIEDGSYLRLKTLSLSYALPQTIIKKTRVLKGLSVSVAAQNVFTWTNYSGMDPEVGIRSTVLTPGFDYSAYPRARTITGRIIASF